MAHEPRMATWANRPQILRAGPYFDYMRLTWRHPADTGCATHIYDAIIGASSSRNGRRRFCDNYMFPLGCDPALRCIGWKDERYCDRSHPCPWDYLHVAAVATALFGYDR